MVIGPFSIYLVRSRNQTSWCDEEIYPILIHLVDIGLMELVCFVGPAQQLRDSVCF